VLGGYYLVKIRKSMSCCPEREKKPFTDYSLVKAGRSIIKHFTDETYDAFVKEDDKIERLKVCEGCEFQRMVFGLKNCGACDCFLDAKASLVEMDCEHPEGSKWPERKI
jgi:hypothetical protein